MKDKTPTRISVILDRSGSMGSMWDEVIGGFNQFLADQRKVPGKTRWTLMQFDVATDVELNYVFTDIKGKGVPKLTRETYQPRGGTPLLDAVGTELSRLLEDKDTKTVVFIVTDGYENSSREYTQPQVQELVKEAEGLGWQVIFMAANIDAAAQGAFIGSATGQTISTDANSYMVATASAGETVSHYRNTGNVTTAAEDTKKGKHTKNPTS